MGKKKLCASVLFNKLQTKINTEKAFFYYTSNTIVTTTAIIPQSLSICEYSVCVSVYKHRCVYMAVYHHHDQILHPHLTHSHTLTHS